MSNKTTSIKSVLQSKNIQALSNASDCLSKALDAVQLQKNHFEQISRDATRSSREKSGWSQKNIKADSFNQSLDSVYSQVDELLHNLSVERTTKLKSMTNDITQQAVLSALVSNQERLEQIADADAIYAVLAQVDEAMLTQAMKDKVKLKDKEIFSNFHTAKREASEILKLASDAELDARSFYESKQAQEKDWTQGGLPDVITHV